MRFRLSREYKKYFNGIIGDGGYVSVSNKNKFLQFDVYYSCALIGFAALRINEDITSLEDMVQSYPKEYKNSKAYIAGLLIASEVKRRGKDMSSRDLEKLMLEYLDNNNDTHLSDEGYARLDAYSLAGADIYRDRSVDSPRTREDFLQTVNNIIRSYEIE
ncbi:MAG: hypothetical protein RR207_06000 [Clostridia bacterium]